MFKKFNEFLKSKFINDVAWTFAGSILLGISGIMINVIIVKFYGAGGLGNFTLALSIYMLLYLFTVFGINNSIIRHVPVESENPQFVAQVVLSGLILVLLNALVLVSIFWFTAGHLATLFRNSEFIGIYKNLLIGLPLFSLNKLLMSFLNSIRRMKAYSFYQALRYILIILLLLIFSNHYRNIDLAALAFPLAEFILFIILSMDTKLYNWFRIPQSFKWFKIHYTFGIYSFLSDGLAEINLKIDNLLIGYFLNPAALGVYAFASEIAKGFMQFAIVVQVNFNPVLCKLWANKQVNELKEYIRKIRNYTYLIYLPIILISIIVYPVFVNLFMPEIATQTNLWTFYILLSGVFIYSGYLSLLGLLTYTGYVKYQFKRALYTLLFNLIGNLLLIPIWGVVGAAIATSLSFIFIIFVINNFSKRKLGIDFFNL